MSKKLRRILDEITKAEEKLALWQEHLEKLHVRRKQIEDAEIIKSVRAMNLEGREMLAFLENLQNGAVPVPQGQPGMDTGQKGDAVEDNKVPGDGTEETAGCRNPETGPGEMGDYQNPETGPGGTENNSGPDIAPAEREDEENEEKD